MSGPRGGGGVLMSGPRGVAGVLSVRGISGSQGEWSTHFCPVRHPLVRRCTGQLCVE